MTVEKIMQLSCTREEIEDRMQNCFPELDYELKGGEYDYTLDVPFVDSKRSEELFEVFESECYGDGEMSLQRTLVTLLQECNLNIATAESCTGGMVASAIVDVPGASDVFYEGVVTYSNLAKIKRLGVSEETLAEYGAVSEETAIEMANGVLRGNVAIGVSTTGVAGPDGGSIEKPVGLVYIAVVSENHTDVYRNMFKGDRSSIRRQAKNRALFFALQHIQKYF